MHIQRSAVMEQQKWSTLRRLARRTQLQPQPAGGVSGASCADGGSSSCLQSLATDGASGLFSPVCDGSSWRQERCVCLSARRSIITMGDGSLPSSLTANPPPASYRYYESFFNLQEPSPTTMMDPASSAMRPASGLLHSQQQQAVSSHTDVDSPVPLALHEPTSTSRSSGSNPPPPSSSYDTIRRSWTASNFMASMAGRMQGSMRWRANGGYEHPVDMMEQVSAWAWGGAEARVALMACACCAAGSGGRDDAGSGAGHRRQRRAAARRRGRRGKKVHGVSSQAGRLPRGRGFGISPG